MIRKLLMTSTLCMAIAIAGCAQNQEGKVAQVPDQKTVTPTETSQAQITPGHTIEIKAFNVPENMPLRFAPALTTRPSSGEIANGQQTMKLCDAGYVVNQYITIAIGNQTPTGTASATGTGTATQTPSLTSTMNPTQTIEPTVAVPVTFGLPGSAVSSQNTTVGRGGTATGQTASPTQTPTWAQALMRQSCGPAGNDMLSAFTAFWQSVFGTNPAPITSQPAAPAAP